MPMTVTGIKSRGLRLRTIFGRKKSTYGLILPEELQAQAQLPKRNRRMNYNSKCSTTGVKDCFVPADLDRWELPQYDSLFNHLITQDGSFRRRLSSSVSNNAESEETNSTGEGEGPFKSVQKWFREIVKSITHQSYDLLDGSAPVDGIPVDMCEKLRYVHVYL